MARGGIDRLFRACVAGVLVMAPVAPAAARTVEVKLVQTADGRAYFDPVGVHIQAGDTVRWIQVSGFHSVTAYHPRNDNHELRIPPAAQPWDSDMLLGQAPRADGVFEHAFTAPGVYDYFCRPHELAGMAGRIVVGDPGDGPGTKPFGYDPAKSWKPVPAAVRKVLPAPGDIVRKGAIRAP